jgi:2-polyprenyl-3-methyl-5-hydroxy-6-metoxy-1,4-benzoquinol methylase
VLDGRTQIRFDDATAYERMMGTACGAIFLDWLAPRAGLRWIDVGCGNGAFTEPTLRAYGARQRDQAAPLKCRQ